MTLPTTKPKAETMTPNTVKVRISPTIANEYMTRGVFGGDEEWPLVPDGPGDFDIPVETARSMLLDAEFNGDSGVGPDEMPLSIGNAYRALAKQLRKAFV